MQKVLFTKIILFTVILFINFDLQATHFRYGHITWEIVDSTEAGIDVKFNVQAAWRTTFFTDFLFNEYGYDNYYNLSLGQKFSWGDFFFGDGQDVPLELTVTSINSTDDWVFGVGEFTHTYTQNLAYEASIEDCCRLNNVNNLGIDVDYRVSTLLDLSV